jgi:hypothetical protein
MGLGGGGGGPPEVDASKRGIARVGGGHAAGAKMSTRRQTWALTTATAAGNCRSASRCFLERERERERERGGGGRACEAAAPPLRCVYIAEIQF